MSLLNPKTDLFGQNSNRDDIPDENPRSSRYMTRIMPKKKTIIYFFSDDFFVKEPRHSETIFAKRRYTSIVARATNKATVLCYHTISYHIIESFYGSPPPPPNFSSKKSPVLKPAHGRNS